MKKTEETSHPVNAEMYDLQDFVERRYIKKESKIVKGLFSEERKEFFICPKCKNRSDNLELGVVYKCDCGISVQGWMFTLYLWA